MIHNTRPTLMTGSRTGSVRTALRGVGVGCGVAVLAAAILAIVSHRRLTAVPLPPPEATAPATTPAVTQPPPPFEPLPAQVQRVERTAQTKQPDQPIELDIRADELSDLIGNRLAGNGIEDLKVYFAEGTVVATGRADVRGRQLYATIRVEPEIQDGQLKLPIKDAQVGKMSMPSLFRDQLQRQIDSALRENPPQKTGVWLDTVQVTLGRMVITGRTTGR